MKSPKRALPVVTAASLLALVSGCSSIPPASTDASPVNPCDCAEMIQDGDFESPAMGGSAISQGWPNLSDQNTVDTIKTLNIPTSFGSGFEQAGPWIVSANGTVRQRLNAVGPQLFVNGVPIEVYNTPDKNQFVAIGGNIDSPSTTLSQYVTLHAGKTYQLSFLQSSFVPGSVDAAIAGKVKVELMTVDLSSDHTIDLLGLPAFEVGVHQQWTPQPPAGQPPIIINISTSGLYSLRFSSFAPDKDGLRFGANIDKVSLLELP